MNPISTSNDGACALKRVIIIITTQTNKVRDDSRISVYHLQRKYHLYPHSSLSRSSEYCSRKKEWFLLATV